MGGDELVGGDVEFVVEEFASFVEHAQEYIVHVTNITVVTIVITLIESRLIS